MEIAEKPHSEETSEQKGSQRQLTPVKSEHTNSSQVKSNSRFVSKLHSRNTSSGEANIIVDEARDFKS